MPLPFGGQLILECKHVREAKREGRYDPEYWADFPHCCMHAFLIDLAVISPLIPLVLVVNGARAVKRLFSSE